MMKCLLLCCLVPWLGACTSLLPKASMESTPFSTYDEARAAIKALVPMQTQRQTLTQKGADPGAYPNTKILTHPDIVRLLLPSAVLTREDLDPGILKCVLARDDCYGMEVMISRIARTRTGGFLADFSNFKRRTETTGWRFNALILFVDDMVVYRTWGGQPLVSETEVNANPLGPFQDVGPSLLSRR